MVSDEDEIMRDCLLKICPDITDYGDAKKSVY